MASVYCTEGRVVLLEMLRVADAANWRLALYKNDFTPSEGSTFENFIQSISPWAAPKTPAFAAAVPVPPDGRTTAPLLTFQHNGTDPAETFYGYYLYHVGFGKVLFAERFPSPKLMAAVTDRIDITASITESTF